MLCSERAVKTGHLALSTVALGGITIRARTALPLLPLADTSSLILPVQQITSVSTVELREGLCHCFRSELRLANTKVTLDPLKQQGG